MIWIDQVVSSGTCFVRVDQRKHYFSGDSVRQSTFIEWIAQSYGFCRAYDMYLEGKDSHLNKAYLVSFNKVKFSQSSIQDKDEVFIEVSLFKEMGNVSIVVGKVYSKDKDIVYCDATVKIYSE
jgi:hypothetical protein